MRELLKIRINDWLIWLLTCYILISNIFFILTFSAAALIFSFPFIILTFIFYPLVIASISPQMIIYDTGIKVKSRYFEWKSIKSISLSSGRYKDNYFWIGLKLPSIQRIYILDMKGKEYSAMIDLDHALKSNRERNNLHRINETFHMLGRTNYLSDWAERR